MSYNIYYYHFLIDFFFTSIPHYTEFWKWSCGVPIKSVSTGVKIIRKLKSRFLIPEK